MQYLTPIPLASLPAAGLPPSALDPLALPGQTARLNKRNGYNAVEFCFPTANAGSGDYALYRYWPAPARKWMPEGPRGATPTTIDTTTAGSVPVRVSTQVADTDVCVVLCNGAGLTTSGDIAPAAIEEQNR